MSSPPRPYTPEWFAIFDEQNFQQAETARMILARVGHDKCCMICGDTRRVGDFMTEEGIAVRTCGDCKTIQENMYGAIMIPMN